MRSEMKGLEGVQVVHLIGIGGIGVSAVARILMGQGYQVQGSDVRASSLTNALEQEGAKIFIGHHEDHLQNVDLVVLSTAIPEHNVEWIAAKERQIPIVHRSEILNLLIHDYNCVIGVTGTHGKGTVSSMLTTILDEAGLEPGFVVGGYLHNFNTNARAGRGDYMVIEVDESDGSHENYDLDFMVCNFLEVDHLNYYDDLDDIIMTMAKVIMRVDRLKTLFVNGDCKGNQSLLSHVDIKSQTYGMEESRDIQGSILGKSQRPIRFQAKALGKDLGEFELNVPGRYNVVNALAAISVCLRLGLDLEVIRRGVAAYKGLENRFTIVEAGDITVIKDYISHPTGIRKVIESARDFAKGRVIGVFKPYRYTLIHYLQDEYGAAFKGCDKVIISKMYAAKEDPIEGVDTMTIVDRIRANGIDCVYIEDQNQITEYLDDSIKPGDQVIFFGGDDYFRMADNWCKTLLV